MLKILTVIALIVSTSPCLSMHAFASDSETMKKTESPFIFTVGNESSLGALNTQYSLGWGFKPEMNIERAQIGIQWIEGKDLQNTSYYGSLFNGSIVGFQQKTFSVSTKVSLGLALSDANQTRGISFISKFGFESEYMIFKGTDISVGLVGGFGVSRIAKTSTAQLAGLPHYVDMGLGFRF